MLVVGAQNAQCLDHPERYATATVHGESAWFVQHQKICVLEHNRLLEIG